MQKSFRPKDGSDKEGSDFHGQKRKNETHASVTDPESRLYRKAAGREARLCYMGHVTMENRNGLVVAGIVTQVDGTAERRTSEAMLKARRKAGRRITVGEDKAYDTADHVAALRKLKITPLWRAMTPRPRPADVGAARLMAAPPAIPAMGYRRHAVP